jgi:tetraacyldisaccharide 4'-kinase
VPADPGESNRLIERIWYDPGLAYRLGRASLGPPSAIFEAVVGLRGALYDRRLLRVGSTAIPAVSVGNITVGGTGKTPLSAWIVETLSTRGRRPGVVLRDYGAGDEVAVHRLLNPQSPVVAATDRLLGVQKLADAGCDVAVLDDGFQHRRVDRVADIVLVSADSWTPERRLLPAGPWRESMRALRRATVVVVTRKAAGARTVSAASTAIARAATGVPVAVATLVPADLRTLGGEVRPLANLRNRRVRAVAGVGWPAAFFAQLEGVGAQIDRVVFPDHHRYTAADVAEIRRRAPPGVAVICTLKDAVKLGGLWPREADPLWYVSQRVEFERGVESVLAALDAVDRVRPATA